MAGTINNSVGVVVNYSGSTFKMSIASFFCLSIEGAGWCETPSRWNLLRCRLLRAKLCIAVMSLRRIEMFSYSETNKSFFAYI